ncbi:MAG: AraC family transcriptional regulator [bacterium]
MKSYIKKPNNSKLTSIIESYWYLYDEKNLKLILPPELSNDLIINLKPPTKFYNNKDSCILYDNYVSGVRSTFYKVEQYSQIEIFGIRFKPWAFSLFFNIPSKGLINKFISINNIESNELITLNNNLNEIQEFNKKESFLDDYIIDNFKLNNDKTALLSEINYLIDTNTGLSVKELSNKIGYSVISIERLFSKYVGITPKQFIRISRYNKIWSLINNPKYNSWADICYEFDYFDQSHFIKEFKEYTGMSPEKYMKNRNLTLDIYYSE